MKVIGLDVGARYSRVIYHHQRFSYPTLLSLENSPCVGPTAEALLALEPQRVLQHLPALLGCSIRTISQLAYHRYPYELLDKGDEGIWVQGRSGEIKIEQALERYLLCLLQVLQPAVNAPILWARGTSIPFAARWRWREILEELSPQHPQFSFSAATLYGWSLKSHGICGIFELSASQASWSLIERREGRVELHFERSRLGLGTLWMEQLLAQQLKEFSPPPHGTEEKDYLSQQRLLWVCEDANRQLDEAREAFINWGISPQNNEAYQLYRGHLAPAYKILEAHLSQWIQEGFQATGICAAEVDYLMLPGLRGGHWRQFFNRLLPIARVICPNSESLAQNAAEVGEMILDEVPIILLERSNTTYSLQLNDLITIPIFDLYIPLPANKKLTIPPPRRGATLYARIASPRGERTKLFRDFSGV